MKQLLFLATALVCFGMSRADRFVMPFNIPDNLMECYNDSTVIKDNLMSMKMSTLIRIVKKLEDSMGSISAGNLALAILRRFRFDGIARSGYIDPSTYVIPYSPNRGEFFLYKLLVELMLTASPQEIANDTLSRVERCTLHQMLSLTIDTTARPNENEDCSKLSKYAPTDLKRRPRSDNRRRSPRSTPDDDVETIENAQTGASLGGAVPGSDSYMIPTYNDDSMSECPIEGGVVYDENGAVCPGIVLAGIVAGAMPQNFSPQLVLELRPKNSPTNKQTPQRPYPRRASAPSPRPSNTPRRGGGGGNIDISNRWGATISGLLSEIMLLQGASEEYKMGGDAGWNDTSIPKYYFLKDSVKDAFTEARMRSAMDGLIIALNIQAWNQAFSGGSLKLSSILRMYYSNDGVFNQDMRACNRITNFASVSSVGQLADQTYAFSKVLQNELPKDVQFSDDGLNQYSMEAANKLQSAITSMSDVGCSQLPGNNNFTAVAVADLHILVDCNWDYNLLFRMVSLASDTVQHVGSNVTLYNAKDGIQMYETWSYPASHIGIGTLCNSTVPKGFDMRASLAQMKKVMDSRLDFEKNYNNEGVTVPRIMLWFPSPSATVSDSDKWTIKDKIASMKVTNPDVKQLFFVPGSRDKFSPFADDGNKDVIVTSAIDTAINSDIDQLAQRIAQIPRRVFNPKCGSSWSSQGYGTVTYSTVLSQWEIQYFRVQPNYFYKNANAKITVQKADATTQVTVCSSRNDPNPGNGTASGCNRVKDGDGNNFWLSDSLCPDMYASRCNPFYFSVSSSAPGRCYDEKCQSPTQVKVTISHSGLSCYSGASAINYSIFVLIAALVLNIIQH